MNSGVGLFVLNSIVRGSTAFMLAIAPTLPVKGAGLFGMSFARSSE